MLRWLSRRVESEAAALYIGSDYGGWDVCSDGVGPATIVYSFGVGEDVSFDVGLIDRFGCQVHAFDPTPRCLDWVRKQQFPAGMHFYPWGISGSDGIAEFYAPRNPAHVSYSSVPNGNVERVQIPVVRLVTIMQKLGHDHVDVLKLDIEGFEYEVIPDLLQSPLPSMLLVEYHDRFRGFSRKDTKQADRLLHEAGYRVFAARERGHQVSYVLQTGPAAV